MTTRGSKEGPDVMISKTIRPYQTRASGTRVSIRNIHSNAIY